MANLFFIHTPLQLLIAQQIIRQEQLQDNVMLYGYVDDNKHFLDIYDLTLLEELWSAKVAMPQVSRWAIISRKHLIRDGWKSFKNYKFIKEVINEYQIDTLYLGDVQNISCQLAAMSFRKQGLKICFFEEGSSHYVMDYGYGIGGGFSDKLYGLFIDAIYYLPLFGVRSGYIRYWKGFTLQQLPMDVRYSVVPFYHEAFDKQLLIEPMLSDKLKVMLNQEVGNIDEQNSVLFLTSPVYEINEDKPAVEAYIETIVMFVKSMQADISLHIKFHPRERETVQSRIIRKLEESRVNYRIIGNTVNIPVEYYLQFMRYNKIVMFLCSTAFYNGYLFPKTVFISVLEDYYNLCKELGSINTKYVETLLSQTTHL